MADKNIYIISDGKKPIEKLPGTFEPYVSGAAYDKYRNRIIFGTYQGELWEYLLADKKFRLIESKTLPQLIIRSVLVPDSDTFLIGMEGGGIAVFDASTDKVLDMIIEDIVNI